MSVPEAEAQHLLQTAWQFSVAGDPDQAIALLQSALETPHQQPELLLLLLELLLQRYDQANGEARRGDAVQIAALATQLEVPAWQTDYRVLHQRGRCHQVAGALQPAALCFEAALNHGAPLELSAAQLAVVRLAQQQWKTAEQLLQPLCRTHAQRVDLWSNLSVALLRQNRLPEALAAVDAALANANGQSPHATADLWLNRGTILQELGQRRKAAQAYHQALEHNPTVANVHTNLGLLAFLEGDRIAAEQLYRRSLALNPADTLAAVNLAGLLLLQNQHLQEAWQLYERRLQGPAQLFTRPTTEAPLWTGQSLNGPLLLVHEQGLGDTFQCIRFARTLQSRGHRLIFQGPSKVHALLLQSALVDHCVDDGESPSSAIAAWTPLMSLPVRLNQLAPQGSSDLAAPYFQIAAKTRTDWQQRLGPKQGLRIALHWQGNPDHEFALSRGRSVPLACLEPLANLEGIEWLALQKGPGSEQMEGSAFTARLHPQQTLISNTWEFIDTAAILQCCELLISSDSGLAHLAGGLGVPVWLMLPALAEWRWGLQGSRSGWYPTHRLYRQPTEGDWAAVIRDIRRDLILQRDRAATIQQG